MQISSHELAKYAKEMHTELKSIGDKIVFYNTDETKKERNQILT